MPFIALIERRREVVPFERPDRLPALRLAGSRCGTPNGPAASARSARPFPADDYPVEDRANVPPRNSPSRRTDAARSQEPQASRCSRSASVRRGARCGGLSAIAQRFHTVILVGIPVMGPDRRNEAARFVTLIDELYEHGEIARRRRRRAARSVSAGRRHFEFQRTVSRSRRCSSARISRRGTCVTA